MVICDSLTWQILNKVLDCCSRGSIRAVPGGDLTAVEACLSVFDLGKLSPDGGSLLHSFRIAWGAGDRSWRSIPLWCSGPLGLGDLEPVCRDPWPKKRGDFK